MGNVAAGGIHPGAHDLLRAGVVVFYLFRHVREVFLGNKLGQRGHGLALFAVEEIVLIEHHEILWQFGLGVLAAASTGRLDRGGIRGQARHERNVGPRQVVLTPGLGGFLGLLVILRNRPRLTGVENIKERAGAANIEIAARVHGTSTLGVLEDVFLHNGRLAALPHQLLAEDFRKDQLVGLIGIHQNADGLALGTLGKRVGIELGRAAGEQRCGQHHTGNGAGGAGKAAHSDTLLLLVSGA